MKLRLLRLGVDVDLLADSVATLEIEDRVLYTRVVSSLLSEAGEYAEEPYLLFANDGKRVSPKNAFHVVNSLPDVPLNDRIMLTRLFRFIAEQSELNPEEYEQIRTLSTALIEATEEIVSGLRGDYSLGIEWNYETYLKSFGLAPVSGRDYTLLDNCIRLLGLCADISDPAPVILVNAKSFFAVKEIDELFQQAVFSGVRLLLLESWRDSNDYSLERKTVIDQHLCLE